MTVPWVTTDQHLSPYALRSGSESEQQGEAGGILFRGLWRKDGECFFFETEHVERLGPRAGAQNVRLQQDCVGPR